MLLGDLRLWRRGTTHINMRSSGKPNSPLISPWFVVYREFPTKKNYNEKICSEKYFHNVLCLSEAKGMDINMDNNSNVGQKNKKSRLFWRMILGVFFSLLFVLSVDMILWAIGTLNTTMNIIIATFVSLLFVLSVGVILWNGGIFDGKK